jgi:hypothetical protein
VSHLHYEKDAIIISKYTTKKDFKQIETLYRLMVVNAIGSN